MKCPTCESCEYAQYCGATEIMRKCERHNKKVDMTNEEWLRQASTEELAEFIVNLTLLDKYKLYDRMESAEYEHGIGVGAKKVIAEWLKQPHKE